MPALLVTVRFVEGRYHGRPEWPPSPARLFQALVAGAARGARLHEDDIRALRWIETLAPPVIFAPPAREGAGFVNFVPNNDLDAVDGDPTRVGELRVGKTIKPRYFEADAPLHYLWVFGENPARALAEQIGSIAERLYQLGRGVDMAHAQAVILNDEATRSFDLDGRAHYPGPTRGALPLACPTNGSLDSLMLRHEAFRYRFLDAVGAGKRSAGGRVFAQPPKPLIRIIGYDSPARLLLYDIRRIDVAKSDPLFAPQPLTKTANLVVTLRDAAAARLCRALPPPRAALVEPVFVGRGATDADKTSRIRIIPLPSVGFVHADRAIRRVLVSVPANCPLPVDDIEWAFSGRDETKGAPDKGMSWSLAPASDRTMLRRYAAEGEKAASVWRSVTPAALPVDRRWGRGGGFARSEAEAAAALAVRDALRHEGVHETALAIRVQREPFDANGARAENFAGARFEPARLWHVEIAFSAPVHGPLVIGDGRWLGLGLMAPEAAHSDGVLAFSIDGGLSARADPIDVARALRRAIMARTPRLPSEKELPLFFTGHEEDGNPARSGAHQHIACVFDEARRRLLILAPHLLERRNRRSGETENWRRLESAMSGFIELRAGVAGLLRLSPASVDPRVDPVFAPSREWLSATRYRVLRHQKRGDARLAFAEDLGSERARNGLPRPEISIVEVGGGRGGLAGTALLRFSQAVPGPILIGRDRHFGGGLFVNGSE